MKKLCKLGCSGISGQKRQDAAPRRGRRCPRYQENEADGGNTLNFAYFQVQFGRNELDLRTDFWEKGLREEPNMNNPGRPRRPGKERSIIFGPSGAALFIGKKPFQTKHQELPLLLT